MRVCQKVAQNPTVLSLAVYELMTSIKELSEGRPEGLN